MGIVKINKLIMGSCKMKTSNSEEKPTAKYSIGIDLDGNRHEFDLETIKPMYPYFPTEDGGYDDDAEWNAVQDIANQLGLDPEGWWEEDVEWTDEEWKMFDEKYIEKYGFSLKCVTHPDETVSQESLVSLIGGDKLTSIGGSAFYACTSLASVDLPNVTSIYEFAFEGCTSLTSVDLPNATSIGGCVFRECTSLESINLQSLSKEYIENNARLWRLGVGTSFDQSFEVHVKCKDGEFILNEKT